MPAHIGIVGSSAEGAALCYRTICIEGAEILGAHTHPEVSMHTVCLAESTDFVRRGDWQGVAGIMLGSARKLAACGADFLICPNNTFHQALPLVEPRSPLPWLHIVDVVADRAAERGFRRVALAGTRSLVASDLYPPRLAARGIECLRPTDAECEDLNRIIMDELLYANFRAESIASVRRIIARLASQGCDAVVLGCTELPLIIDDSNSALPPLDSTRLLARAALRRALQGGAG
jgi:aspartate racemase